MLLDLGSDFGRNRFGTVYVVRIDASRVVTGAKDLVLRGQLGFRVDLVDKSTGSLRNLV